MTVPRSVAEIWWQDVRWERGVLFIGPRRHRNFWIGKVAVGRFAVVFSCFVHSNFTANFWDSDSFLLVLSRTGRRYRAEGVEARLGNGYVWTSSCTLLPVGKKGF